MYTKDATFYTAEEDIVVYKVLKAKRASKDNSVKVNGKYKSLYSKFEYEDGITYNLDPYLDSLKAVEIQRGIEASEETDWRPSPYRLYQVNKGFHSFKDADLDLIKEHHSFVVPDTLVKFVIPKGATYIKGWDNNKEIMTSFVSNKIKCIGKIADLHLHKKKDGIYQLCR